jgi:hypothetical protein
MPLSWNEIRDRAVTFSREWVDEASEDAEAKSFWDGFFNVFGITRRRVASFEAPVKKGDGQGGFIDLLWKGVLLVEHKSRGKDLDRAARQAFDYFPGLKERDLPRYVLVSDFARFRLHDLDTKEQHDFLLADFSKNIKLFGFIAGYQTRSFGQQDPVNIQAAEKLGKLHDLLKSSGYDGHPLEVLLVRILFCMFAEDTALFERCQFQDYLEQRTAEDGSDLGMHLAKLFQVLDTAPERRSQALDEQLSAFPYVNGQLFSEALPISDCTRQMREALLDCCALDWSRISPAIFGSLFQSIMDTTARRNLGAHYTSETNILKLIHPLFLDELWAEFHKVKRNKNQLFEFLKKLAYLTFFDPACGCGNFLVIAYRELRLLELEVLRHVRQSDQLMLDVFQLIGVNVDQFHGIEIEEWPARIAEVALWLTDHQMNLKVSEEFGQYYARLPLKKAPHIVHGNALRIDWNEVVPAWRLSYLLGNPPFVGKKEQNAGQKSDLLRVFSDQKGVGVLDYVCCWYRKAVDYMAENPAIRAAFVSTNSITQGEQTGILWPDILRRGAKIHFAHRTFQWCNEARGKAAVHCVIVGFGLQDVAEKILYDYETPKSEPQSIKVNRINPYLVDAPDIVVEKRMHPLCSVPEMDFGSKAADFGHLVLDDTERNDLLAKYPSSAIWIRPFLGSEEFINGKTRYCLWLKGVSPADLKKCPDILARIEKVRIERLKSVDANTRRWADTPALFQADRQPDTDYLVIPKVSSERRPFIPLGFMSPHYITNPSILVVPNATLYHFGVLQATMHMAWTRSVCGRMKSDYQYSNTIVFNNFPWPEPSDKQQSAIETAAQGVLDARSKFPTSTLADLYDPLTMPQELVKAHQTLDRAVDAAYGKTGFKTEAERVSYLFERYQQLIAPLVGAVGGREKKKILSKGNGGA